MSRAGRTRGQSDRRDHRQPERQERRKRAAKIDPHGYNAGKKIKDKKRHILVDTQGLLLHALVQSAHIQDRDGGILVMATLFGLHPFLLKLYADGGYEGPIFQAGMRRVCRQIDFEIIKRSGKGLHDPATLVGGRKDDCLVELVPPPRQGLGMPKPESPRLPASRLNSPYAAKALSKKI